MENCSSNLVDVYAAQTGNAKGTEKRSVDEKVLMVVLRYRLLSLILKLTWQASPCVILLVGIVQLKSADCMLAQQVMILWRS